MPTKTATPRTMPAMVSTERKPCLRTYCQLMRRSRIMRVSRGDQLAYSYAGESAAGQFRQNLADGDHRVAPIDARRDAVPIVQASDAAVLNLAENEARDLCRFPFPVVADHSPHYAQEMLVAQRRAQAEPARAVRSAEQARSNACGTRNGILGLRNFLANARW